MPDLPARLARPGILRSATTRIAAVLALALLSTACARMEMDMPREGPKPAFEAQEMRQLIAGVETKRIFSDAESLRAGLARFGVPEPTSRDLGDWIDAIRAAQEAGETNVLGGLGGIPAHGFLRAAEMALDAKGMLKAGVVLKVDGQILESVQIIPGYVEPGYYYDAEIDSGHLWVRMHYSIGLGAAPIASWAYRFNVSVGPGHFKVAKRDDSSSADVFPNSNTVPISKALAESRGAKYKLWARGTSVRVDRVDYDPDYDPANPNFSLVTLNDPNLGDLYVTNDESCIDMMFQDYPPETLPAGAEPPFYCLGRCANPPIINTM